MTTFLNQEVTLSGTQLQVGDSLKDVTLLATDLSLVSLSDFSGKKKVVSVVPSLDTGICSTQTRHFNQAIADRDDAVVITISEDLPFAQGRWCGAAGLEQAVVLSDYRDHSFGKTYGLLMEEWQLLARAVLVFDANDQLVYTEYLENVNSEPNYDAALQALNALN